VIRLPLLLLTAFILLGTAVPLRAETRASPVDLNVCNRGTVPVEVVTAEKNDPLLGMGTLY
jgi:hypothetical protein